MLIKPIRLTWFTTLPPNSILNWAQLERTFHEQLFRGETHVSLIGLINIQRFPAKLIDDYLNRLRQIKVRYYTQIPEHSYNDNNKSIF